MQTAADVRKGILTYLVLTFGLSSIFYYLIVSAGTLSAGGGLYVLGLMWCPGTAALLTRLLYQRNLHGMGWGWGRTRYQLWSYLLPLGYAAVVYFPVWLFGLGELNLDVAERAVTRLGLEPTAPFVTFLLFLLVAGTLGVALSCVSALGEEIGWRGFLVPELAKVTSFTRVALISGAVWSVWHYPILLFADYRAPTSTWFSLACFTVMVVAISFPFAWLRLKSGSVWTGMLLHGSHNLFIQGVFDAMTKDTGVTYWIIGEFGAGLAITGAVVAWLYWRQRAALPATSTIS